MTVAELIETLEKIENKSLEVVANIGRDFCDYPVAEVIGDAIEMEEYFGTIENGKWCVRTRKCVKIIG